MATRIAATPESLKAVQRQFLNGSDGRTRHPFLRRFIYTDGVKAVADHVGGYWLLDIVATEVAPITLQRWKDHEDPLGFFIINVKGKKAQLSYTRDTGATPLWKRTIDYTDWPEGEWKYELAIDGVLIPGSTVAVMLLLEEH